MDDDIGDESPSSNGDKLQVCDLSEAPKFVLRPRCYLSDQTKNELGGTRSMHGRYEKHMHNFS
jgi:hypothetical protein